MTHDTEALVATLQLLLGDFAREDLEAILSKAFWPRVKVFGAVRVSALKHELGQIGSIADRAEADLKSPPLGLLGCERIRQEMAALAIHKHRIENILDNPGR